MTTRIPDTELIRPDELILLYEALMERSLRMLISARDANWTQLIEDEAQYVVEAEKLSRLDASPPLSREQQERKADLLEKIFENGLEVRRLLEERRELLSRQLHQHPLGKDVAPVKGGRRGKGMGRADEGP